MTKICTTCKKEKELSEFSPHIFGKFGVRSKCKLCSTKDAILYNISHKQERKQYYLNNKEKLLKQHKKYHKDNKEHVKKQTKDYRERKKEQIKKQQRRWRKSHKNFLRHRENRNYKLNIQFKLRSIIRKRILLAIKNNQKSGHSLELLGCSIEFLKQYLELQFKDGMCWENHGQFGWHIDHIKPCASFDLSKPEEQRKCFHYTNLQPLWWLDNLQKTDKYAE